MLLKEVIKLNKEIENKTFDDIKHIDENGIEFWYARELMIILRYSKWENFKKVIKKAMITCENSGYKAIEHFPDVRKTIKMPKGAEKEIEDYKLTRYACYIIAQNGDSRKETIALAQTYFAIQTRKQEITEKEACNTHNKIVQKYRYIIIQRITSYIFIWGDFLCVKEIRIRGVQGKN